jgi:hypothetical protein
MAGHWCESLTLQLGAVSPLTPFCMTEGLVGGEAFAVDASMVVADTHRQRGVVSSGELTLTSNRAVTEYLAVDSKIAEHRGRIGATIAPSTSLPKCSPRPSAPTRRSPTNI